MHLNRNHVEQNYTVTLKIHFIPTSHFRNERQFQNGIKRRVVSCATEYPIFEFRTKECAVERVYCHAIFKIFTSPVFSCMHLWFRLWDTLWTHDRVAFRRNGKNWSNNHRVKFNCTIRVYAHCNNASTEEYCIIIATYY